MKRPSRLFRRLPRMTFILILLFMTVLGNTSVQAASKSVYVISKIVQAVKMPMMISKSSHTITYNKNGLVTKVKMSKGYTYKYKYNKKNQLVQSEYIDINHETTDLELDKKGRVKQKGSIIFKYNSKGKLKSTSNPDNSYTYNSKGQLIKVKLLHDKTTVTYTYDARGMIASEKERFDSRDPIDYTYTNTYDKNGNLKKQIQYEQYNFEAKKLSAVTTFTYKKISVPASLVPRIKAQQMYLYREYAADSPYIYPFEGIYK